MGSIPHSRSKLWATFPDAKFSREYLRLFAPMVSRSMPQLVIGILSLIFGSLCLVRASIELGKICATLGSSIAVSRDLYQSMIFFVLLEAVSVAANYLGRILLARGTNQVLLELREALFHKLATLPMSYFDTQPMGRVITRLTNDVEGVEGFFGGGLARIATACVQIILVLAGIIGVAPAFGFFVTLAAIPSLGFSWLTRRPVRYWLAENKSRNAHVNAKLAEFIQGLPVLRVFGLEAWSGEEFGRDAGRYMESSIKVLLWNSFIRPVTVFLSVLPGVVAVIYGAWLLMHGEAEIAGVVAVIRLTERFTSPVRIVTQEIQVIQDASASAVRVGEMLSRPGERSQHDQNTGIVRDVVGRITFENVTLSYGKGHDVLRSFCLDVPAGQKLGIIGATGAGKSTILNMIPGLYAASEGSVYIDGVDISKWDLKVLRSQIGYLAQDPFLFQGTLAANIFGMGAECDEKTRRDFLRLVQQVGLGDVLARFDSGLNMRIRESGANLSSGEKQMVAFMRLIYENRPIILMDEATSCMDSSWESAIQGAMLALMSQRKRTCLVIAHRLDTLKSCDRVIRIDGGKLVADGTLENCLRC